MGEECPLPGTGIFQRTWLVSLQRIGGLACGATPLANGPRHCGQLFETAALSQVAPRSASADTASRRRQPRVRSDRNGSIIRDLYTPCWSRLKAAIPQAADGILRRLNRKERIERIERRNEERVLALRAGTSCDQANLRSSNLPNLRTQCLDVFPSFFHCVLCNAIAQFARRRRRIG